LIEGEPFPTATHRLPFHATLFAPEFENGLLPEYQFKPSLETKMSGFPCDVATKNVGVGFIVPILIGSTSNIQYRFLTQNFRRTTFKRRKTESLIYTIVIVYYGIDNGYVSLFSNTFYQHY
jgi:hypothetical protein